VKTQNFLVDDQFHVKVIDFGVSRIIDSSKQMTLIGTPVWMAPEVISRSKYTEKADVYSYGLVLWAMVSATILNYGFFFFAYFGNKIV